MSCCCFCSQIQFWALWYLILFTGWENLQLLMNVLICVLRVCIPSSGCCLTQDSNSSLRCEKCSSIFDGCLYGTEDC